MRILHFYKTYKPDTQGGVEQLIWQLCSGAAQRGVITEVLTLSRDTSVVDMGDHLHYRAHLDFEVASSGFSRAAFGMFREHAELADVVHYHFPWPFMDVVHFATGIRKPSVVTYHSDVVRQKRLLQIYRPLMHRFLNSVDAIVATSPQYAETSEVLRRHAHKVRIIPIGLDRTAYPPAGLQKLTYWRKQLGQKFFLFVGNIRYYKGLHFLLEALVGTDFPIAIVGSGPLEQALRLQAHQLGLQRVHFLGALPDDDKFALLTLCHCLVFPSHLRSEAFGISLLEGAMFGKPMISCELGTGTSYVNANGVTGIVVPPENPAALRQAMSDLWIDDVAAERMGRAAEARYWKYFTADAMMEKYVYLYKQLIVNAELKN